MSSRALFMLLLQLLSLSSAAIAENMSDNVWSDCRDSGTCAIEYNHLADQVTNPFLFLGKVMDETHPRWSEFETSMNQFNSVRSCLAEAERKKETPNLLKFDWIALDGRPEREVCLFRLISSLKDLDRIEDWFSYFGFKSEIHIEPVGSAKASSGRYRIHSLSASIPIEEFRKVKSHWLHSLTGLDPAYNFAVDLSFSAEMRLTHVSASENLK